MSGILNHAIKYLSMSGFKIGTSYKKVSSQTMAKAPSLEFYYIKSKKSAILEASWYFVQYQSTAAVVEAAYGVYRQFGPIPPYLDLPFKFLRR